MNDIRPGFEKRKAYEQIEAQRRRFARMAGWNIITAKTFTRITNYLNAIKVLVETEEDTNNVEDSE